MLTHQEQLRSSVNKPPRAGGAGGGGSGGGEWGVWGRGAGLREGDFELAGEEITRWLDNCCPGPLRLGGGKQLNANTRRHQNSLAVNCGEKFHQPGQSVDVSVADKLG